LDSLGLIDNPAEKKIMVEELIDGVKDETIVRTTEDNLIMANLTNKMQDIFKWNGKKSFLFLAAQKCSDMILHVCKLN
jgi:hypothetical protein